ncbi:MAG: hypothetical protein ACO1OO_13025 [Flavisolibacter sp.]
MKDHVLEILDSGFNEFYKRCSNVYNIGNQELYSGDVLKVKKKYCFNPFVATECDVQVKLGGLLEELFRNRNLPYTVNSEMKIYDLPARNQRADLSIHRIAKDQLYLEHSSPMDTLIAVFEIKYANAAHPYYEFKNDAIKRDAGKLATLGDNVLKFLVIIDEAMKISLEVVTEIASYCRDNEISIVSNNPALRSSLPRCLKQNS